MRSPAEGVGLLRRPRGKPLVHVLPKEFLVELKTQNLSSAEGKGNSRVLESATRDDEELGSPIIGGVRGRPASSGIAGSLWIKRFSGMPDCISG